MDTAGKSLVAESPAMRQTIKSIREIAPHVQLNVLVAGETGAGKSLVAQEVHRRSPRASAPFVSVNCGEINGNLIESDLFGHVRGAFSGASDSREGFFRKASGGTLFLDEIGHLPLNLQTRLFRVLDVGKVRPVGGDQEIPVNVRVISATNLDLPEMVARGEFRQELYYRLMGSLIWVPPLRERREDIPKLIEQICSELKAAKPLSSEALELFLQYSLPPHIP